MNDKLRQSLSQKYFNYIKQMFECQFCEIGVFWLTEANYETELCYPCTTCVRVKDPANCENKKCRDWSEWFLERWEAMRQSVRLELKRRKKGE